MSLREEYLKENGPLAYIKDGEIFSPLYVKWLEQKLSHPPVTVSDEEIEQKADSCCSRLMCGSQYENWIDGAKWIRDRLTQRKF